MTDATGIRIEVPETAVASPSGGDVRLPSGSVATVRAGTGKDLRLAQAVIGQDTSRFMFAIIAQVTAIDGKKLTMEGIDALPIGDVIELQAEVNRVNFPTPPTPAEAAS